jgi:hypothetical protein
MYVFVWFDVLLPVLRAQFLCLFHCYILFITLLLSCYAEYIYVVHCYLTCCLTLACSLINPHEFLWVRRPTAQTIDGKHIVWGPPVLDLAFPSPFPWGLRPRGLIINGSRAWLTLIQALPVVYFCHWFVGWPDFGPRRLWGCGCVAWPCLRPRCTVYRASSCV